MLRCIALGASKPSVCLLLIRSKLLLPNGIEADNNEGEDR